MDKLTSNAIYWLENIFREEETITADGECSGMEYIRRSVVDKTKLVIRERVGAIKYSEKVYRLTL